MARPENWLFTDEPVAEPAEGTVLVKTLELSLDGKNLLHERHLEFVNPSLAAAYVPRSVTLSARWTP